MQWCKCWQRMAASLPFGIPLPLVSTIIFPPCNSDKILPQNSCKNCHTSPFGPACKSITVAYNWTIYITLDMCLQNVFSLQIILNWLVDSGGLFGNRSSISGGPCKLSSFGRTLWAAWTGMFRLRSRRGILDIISSSKNVKIVCYGHA